MKVIIAGSRTINNYEEVELAVKDSGFIITEVVCGGAKGIDTLGNIFAINNKLDVKFFLPNWKVLGKKAGLFRNRKMGDYADALIAIWDGSSKGTEHMIHYMKWLNKPIFIRIVNDKNIR